MQMDSGASKNIGKVAIDGSSGMRYIINNNASSIAIGADPAEH
jgi:hypothetical protein